MDTTWLTVLMAICAAACFGLGGLVFYRDPANPTNRAFAVVSVNLMLWTGGVAFIIQSSTEEAARFWVTATFVVAAFLPATFHHFICVFPSGRFQGLRAIQGFLYAAGALLAAGTLFTPWHIESIEVFPGRPPLVTYGPLFPVFGVCVGVAALLAFINLFRKRATAQGIERRQVEHVILGIFVSMLLAIATNVLAPVLGVHHLEAYGPLFTLIMVIIFAYAMVRYQLLDVWVIISRTALYTFLTAFVVITFFGAVALVHLVVSEGGRAENILPTVMAAVIIALVLQPIKERVQLLLDRFVVKRRYDTHALLRRISQNAGQLANLDELLAKISDDVRDTIGVTSFRVLLLDEKEPAHLITEYSSEPGETKERLQNFSVLVNHLRTHGEPIIREQLGHAPPSRAQTELRDQLEELQAELCLPLATSSGLIGMLLLGPKTSRDVYSAEDLALFVAAAGHLATAIENGRLYRKLEEANMHRARILSNMRGGVIAVDTTGLISTVNQGAVELIGPVEWGTSIDSLPGQVRDVLKQTLQERRAVRDFETLLTRPDGQHFHVVMSTSSLVATDDTPLGAMVMIYDLTQVKRLEQNVKRADRLSSLGVLAAGMAHEIKNPLVSIKSLSQLLVDRYNDTDFRTTFSDLVPQEVDRIDSIVSRLLDFARPRPTDFAYHDIRTIIEKVLALVENQIVKHRIRVETDFSTGEVTVFGDEQQLHQVFLNLALNAIDAMIPCEGGVLRISVDHGRMYPRHSGVSAYLEVDCVVVRIADTGCGIDADRLDVVFAPFYTSKENGSGLGLAVVHGILTEHNGDIDVESWPGEGTAFSVRLPLVSTTVSAEGNSQ